MADELDAVDPAEVAALEAAAEGRRATSVLEPTAHAFVGDGTGLCEVCQLANAAKVHAVEPTSGMAVMMADAAEAERNQMPRGFEPHRFVGRLDRNCEQCGAPDRNPVHFKLVGDPKPEPKGALESLVETLVEQAVGKRLDQIERILNRVEVRGLHSMAIAMFLGDRFQIDQAQLDDIYKNVLGREAAAGRKEQP